MKCSYFFAAVALLGFVGCVKATTPETSMDMMPLPSIPKSSAPASGAATPTPAPSSAASTTPPACPAKLVTDYQASMATCMRDPMGSACSDSGQAFLANYPNANCTFTDTDGTKNSLKVEGGRIHVNVNSDGSTASSAGAGVTSSPPASQSTPSATPITESNACPSYVVAAYNDGANVCERLNRAGWWGSTDEIRNCSDGAQEFLTLHSATTCYEYDSDDESADSSGALLISSSRIARLKAAADSVLNTRVQATEPSNPPTDTADSTDEETTPSCPATLVAKYAQYLKNTTVCRLGGSRLAAHRKACVELASTMKKQGPSEACQVATSVGAVKAGSTIDPEAIADDLAKFQRR